MKKTHSRVAALAAVCAAAIAAPAIARHSWGGYHWAGNGTNITLTINKAITSQWTIAVNTAIADWEVSDELTLPYGDVSVSRKRCNPISGQILVCNDSYGQRGWLGIASIWLSSGHISQGTTKLNDSYFNTATYNTPAWRSMVACQEIGHDFGLDHQDEEFGPPNLGTCMDYTNDPAGGGAYLLSNLHPNTHDYDMLKTIYTNHNDTAKLSTNFGIRQVGQPAGPASSEGIGDSPSTWGRAIHRDGLGRPDVYVKDLGPGQKVITHVFWALGEGPNGRL